MQGLVSLDSQNYFTTASVVELGLVDADDSVDEGTADAAGIEDATGADADAGVFFSVTGFGPTLIGVTTWGFLIVSGTKLVKFFLL